MTTTLQPVSVRILADDLTGACDAAVAFACVGLATEVETSWTVSGSSQAAVLACNTESRDLSPTDSTERINQAATRFANQPTHLFKKIDSVFRGNTFTEIAAALKAFPHDVAILAPAFPELGRIIVNGDLHYHDVAGAHTLPVLDELSRIGLSPILISAPSQIDLTQKLLVCDSATQQDLSLIVQTALQLGTSTRLLWIGSGGLAHALAENLDVHVFPQSSAMTGGRILFLIGSDHPVTLKQLEHLAISEPAAAVLSIPRGLSTPKLYELIAPYLASSISCLFATGGDTALAICRALGIERLAIQSEFARGVPQARILGGLLDGATFIMKSGGFGDETVLSRIAQTFSSQETRLIR